MENAPNTVAKHAKDNFRFYPLSYDLFNDGQADVVAFIRDNADMFFGVNHLPRGGVIEDLRKAVIGGHFFAYYSLDTVGELINVLHGTLRKKKTFVDLAKLLNLKLHDIARAMIPPNWANIFVDVYVKMLEFRPMTERATGYLENFLDIVGTLAVITADVDSTNAPNINRVNLVLDIIRRYNKKSEFISNSYDLKIGIKQVIVQDIITGKSYAADYGYMDPTVVIIAAILEFSVLQRCDFMEAYTRFPRNYHEVVQSLGKHSPTDYKVLSMAELFEANHKIRIGRFGNYSSKIVAQPSFPTLHPKYDVKLTTIKKLELGLPSSHYDDLYLTVLFRKFRNASVKYNLDGIEETSKLLDEYWRIRKEIHSIISFKFLETTCDCYLENHHGIRFCQYCGEAICCACSSDHESCKTEGKEVSPNALLFFHANMAILNYGRMGHFHVAKSSELGCVVCGAMIDCYCEDKEKYVQLAYYCDKIGLSIFIVMEYMRLISLLKKTEPSYFDIARNPQLTRLKRFIDGDLIVPLVTGIKLGYYDNELDFGRKGLVTDWDASKVMGFELKESFVTFEAHNPWQPIAEPNWSYLYRRSPGGGFIIRGHKKVPDLNYVGSALHAYMHRGCRLCYGGNDDIGNNIDALVWDTDYCDMTHIKSNYFKVRHLEDNVVKWKSVNKKEFKELKLSIISSSGYAKEWDGKLTTMYARKKEILVGDWIGTRVKKRYDELATRLSGPLGVRKCSEELIENREKKKPIYFPPDDDFEQDWCSDDDFLELSE